MRKVIIGIGMMVVVAAGLGLWFFRPPGQQEGPFRTEEVKRRDLLASFSATGTLEPEDVIDVGAQVAGQIKDFGVDSRTSKPIDYGSEVEAGAVLAKIDDSLYKAKVNQSRAMVTVAKATADQAVAKVDDAKANVNVAQANMQVAQANSDHAKRDWDRAQRLVGTQALVQADFDTYRSANDTARATVAQTEATLAQAKVQVTEAEAAAANARANVAAAEAILNQDEINLGYTVITSPVRGVIIDRRVTLGQTVQSSFNTPSLFLLARDLKRMKVWASVNEADIGQVHVGQTVKFTVDSYAGQTFTGQVSVIRLNATMTNNVVTYTVEVLTDNATGKLLPYMTANLRFEIENRTNVLTVSNEALRWTPDLSQVAPDAREAFGKSKKSRDGGDAVQEGKESKPAKDGAAKVGSKQNRGVVWVQDGNFVRPVPVKLGLRDDTRTEIVEGNLQEGSVVVTGDLVQNSGDDGSNPFTPNVSGGKKQ